MGFKHTKVEPSGRIDAHGARLRNKAREQMHALLQPHEPVDIGHAGCKGRTGWAMDFTKAIDGPTSTRPHPRTLTLPVPRLLAFLAMKGEEIDPSELSTPALLTPEKHARVFKVGTSWAYVVACPRRLNALAPSLRMPYLMLHV